MFWQETVLLKVHTQLFIRTALKQLGQKCENGICCCVSGANEVAIDTVLFVGILALVP